MNLKNYYHELPSSSLQKILKQYDNADHKTDVWNTFVDSELEGITDDDFSIYPRVIPASYFSVIERTCKDITTFLLKLLSLPPAEMKAIIPPGPMRNYLINEIEILRLRPNRLIGSFRFDMAIVGEPTKNNPPQLLEVNEIGFDGLARSTYFQKTLLDLIPDLKTKVTILDTARAEVSNMLRLGKDIVRLQYDCYNWDEVYLKQTADQMNCNLHLVSPTQYKCKIDKKDYPLLSHVPFNFKNNKVIVGDNLRPDAFNMSFALAIEDLKIGRKLYGDMIRSTTPQYGPLITNLVASKTILILLNDPGLRKKFLGSSRILQDAILPAFSLEQNAQYTHSHAANLVIKHTDGFGGEQVFMGAELQKWIKKIPKNRQHEWVVQKKTFLNSIDVNGILSRPKKVISDLGVFIQYDWENGKFSHFEVGGLMCRATNKSLKVNVSGGGLQVAVMLENGK